MLINVIKILQDVSDSTSEFNNKGDLMPRQKFGRTAEATAMFRAMESMQPEASRVCDDYLAKSLVGFPFRLAFRNRWSLRSAYKQLARQSIEAVYGEVVARTRYIDELLRRDIADGVEQVVVLGAGLDSRAYRFDRRGEVRFYEVDRPATQAVKVSRIGKAIGKPPGGVIYVPVDFEEDELESQLIRAGYNAEKKTLFIVEGVIMYLTPDTVNNMFASIARNTGPGSSVVFNYVFRSAIAGAPRFEDAGKQRELLNRWGEPFLFGMDMEDIKGFVAGHDLQEIENLSPPELAGRFPEMALRGLETVSYVGIVHAAVGSAIG